MTLFNVFLVLAVLFALAGIAFIFLQSFAYVTVLVIGAVFALGARGGEGAEPTVRCAIARKRPDSCLSACSSRSMALWLITFLPTDWMA